MPDKKKMHWTQLPKNRAKLRKHLKQMRTAAAQARKKPSLHLMQKAHAVVAKPVVAANASAAELLLVELDEQLTKLHDDIERVEGLKNDIEIYIAEKKGE